MCHFITAVLDADASLDAVNDVGRAFGIAFAPAPREQLANALLDSEIYLIHRVSHCDCGTELGARHRRASTVDTRVERGVLRLRRKGWSDSKIQRWLDDRARRAAAGRPRSPDVRSWVSFLRTVTDLTGCRRFGVLLHWYRGDVASETFSFDRVTLPSSSLNEDLLLDMPEDRLLVFHA